MKEHRANGGEIFQSVLNQAIKPQVELKVSLPLLNKAWAEMTKTMAWRKLVYKYGLYGYVRLQEEAFNTDTWFPHFHVIWFFNERFGYDHMLTFTLEVADLWATYSNKVGAIGTSAFNQLQDTIDEGSEKSQANYLFKHGFLDLVFDPGTVDLEHDSLTPFEFLVYTLYQADADLMDKWEDFEKATSGTKRVVLSKKLKEMETQLQEF
jgi:hypothetical protein